MKLLPGSLPRNWVSCPSPLSRRLPSSSNCWSFDKYRDRLRKLLDRHGEGTTRYQASVAKTWNITLEGLNPLARALLRFAAWFGPDAIPRDIFSVGPTILSEGLGESIEDLDLAIEEALGELARFSLIRLTSEAVSVHRLLQAVEQNALTKEECARWLEWAVRLFNTFAPNPPDDVRTWCVWLALRPHAEALIKNTQSQGMNATPVSLLANRYAMFLYARANYSGDLLDSRLCRVIRGRANFILILGISFLASAKRQPESASSRRARLLAAVFCIGSFGAFL
jgi:hypothetical protein